ncbi:MAG: glutamate formimidoyltransferase [Aggregatilineales bacterium]
MSLIECVPNFSEGRRPEVIEAIKAAILQEDVYLLDVSADVDHNRCVITFAGEPEPVQAAMYRGAEVAVSLIDLDQHRGVHPRIGAVDVIPFVPLRDISLTACVQIAREFGKRLADGLDIPVYLYEAAALRPDRKDLAHIRRGGYEALKTAISTDPDRAPDFGPCYVGRAGAVAVGARGLLIAFNVYLQTSDVTIAKQIASAIRAANGGLPQIKALGLLVGGRAQVSINLINYRVTSLYMLMNAVCDHAARLGVSVESSELVGLVPQAALIETALAALRLSPAVGELILERRLGDATGDYREVNSGW